MTKLEKYLNFMNLFSIEVILKDHRHNLLYRGAASKIPEHLYRYYILNIKRTKITKKTIITLLKGIDKHGTC